MAGLIATPSAVDANSYLTIEEADELMDGFDQSDKWDDLEDPDQAQLLLEATRMVDQYHAWGPRKETTQRLAFPRTQDASAKVPEEVRLAVAEYLNFKLADEAVALKKLQAEGVTSASILGQNTSFETDPSGLPAGSRRELDKLVKSHWPIGTVSRELDGTTDLDSFFG